MGHTITLVWNSILADLDIPEADVPCDRASDGGNKIAISMLV